MKSGIGLNSDLEIVLFAGMHRTGTTSVQRYLEKRRQNYCRKCTLLYSDSYSRSVQAYDLAEHVIRKGIEAPFRMRVPSQTNRRQRFVSRVSLVRQLGSLFPRRIFISMECISLARTDAEMKALRRFVGGKTLRIVHVQRDRRTFLDSYKRTLEEMEMPIRQRGNSALNVGEGEWVSDTSSFVFLARKYFGGGNVTCLKYEELVEKTGDVVPEIVRAGGANALCICEKPNRL